MFRKSMNIYLPTLGVLLRVMQEGLTSGCSGNDSPYRTPVNHNNYTWQSEQLHLSITTIRE